MDDNITQLTQKIKSLEIQLKKLQDNQGYGLKREEKPEQFDERTKDALPILKEETQLQINNHNDLDHLIIEGDNYHSLSVLNYTHKGMIDVIYIDPPYNTGNKDFIYNDNYVDKEDSYRHSKWLSFMHKRLRLAKNLLSDQGVIFISIDDNEQAPLKLLCDDIFGENNFLSCITWRRKKESANDNKGFSMKGEYILVYAKSENIIINFLPLSEDYLKTSYSEPNDMFPLGKWRPVTISISKGHQGSGYEYEIETPKGTKIKRLRLYPEKGYKKLLSENRIYFGKSKNGIPQRVMYDFESLGTPPDNIWYDLTTNKEGKKEIVDIFDIDVFSTPKPTKLIKQILKLTTNNINHSTILDFFAGSGTTGHAVLDLNKEDGGRRQFILCSNRENTADEPDKNICKNITYERVKRVMQGYTNAKGEQIEGLCGGNLRYYTTEFIKTTKSTDDLRHRFINLCDDLLCIKEDTFTPVIVSEAKQSKTLKCFQKGEHYTAVCYDVREMDNLRKMIQDLDGKVSVYVFSLSKESCEEELADLPNVVVQNIPDDILETYKKIFQF